MCIQQAMNAAVSGLNDQKIKLLDSKFLKNEATSLKYKKRTEYNPFDMFINGTGFFVVKNRNNQNLHTRNGDFQIDKDGFLKNQDGNFLQSYKIENTVVNNELSYTNVAFFNSPPSATSQIEIDMNLPATSSSQYATIEIHGSLGVKHEIQLQFDRIPTPDGSPANTAAAWQVTLPKIYHSDKIIDTKNKLQITPNIITFNQNGMPNIDPTISIDFSNIKSLAGGFFGSNASKSINIDLGSLGQSDGITMFGSKFDIYKKEANGFTNGRSCSFSINDQGVIQAKFTNGTERDLFQIPVVTFDKHKNIKWDAFTKNDSAIKKELNSSFDKILGDLLLPKFIK